MRSSERSARHWSRAAIVLGLVVLSALSAMGTALHGAAAARHTKLERSAPAADSTVASSPTSIQLWFNELVPIASTRIRLTDAAGAVIALGAPRRDSASVALPVTAAVRSPLAPGRYRVDWVTASRDGHAVSGHFAFRVREAP